MNNKPISIQLSLLPFAPSKEEKDVFLSGLRGERVSNNLVKIVFKRQLNNGRNIIGNSNSRCLVARMNPFTTGYDNNTVIKTTTTTTTISSEEGSNGVLRFLKIDFERALCRKYQLQILEQDEDDEEEEEEEDINNNKNNKKKKKKKIVARDVEHLEFIDENQIVFAQKNSKNILYANLTSAVHQPSQVYLFGKHEKGVVSCLSTTKIATNTEQEEEQGVVVASGATDGSLYVYTVKDGKKVGSIRKAHDGEGGVTCVSVVWGKRKKEVSSSLNDIIVASGGSDGIVRLWNVDDNIRLKMLCRLDNGVSRLSCVCLKYYFSNDDDDDREQNIARVCVGSSNEGTFRVWKSTPFKSNNIKSADWSVELLQNQVAKRLRGKFNNAVSVDFCTTSHDGKYLAFSSTGVNSDNEVEKSIVQVMRLRDKDDEQAPSSEKWVTKAATEDLGALCSLQFQDSSYRLFAPSKENGVPRILDVNLKPARLAESSSSSADDIDRKPVARPKPLPHVPEELVVVMTRQKNETTTTTTTKKKTEERENLRREDYEDIPTSKDDDDDAKVPLKSSSHPSLLRSTPKKTILVSSAKLEDIWDSTKREPRVCDSSNWSSAHLLLNNASKTVVDY